MICLELRERADVVCRVRGVRNSCSLYLHCGDAQPIPGRYLRVRVVADHEHLTRLESVRAEYLREDCFFSLRLGSSIALMYTRSKSDLHRECAHFALLQASESRRYQEQLCGQLPYGVEIGIAAHRHLHFGARVLGPAGGEHLVGESVLSCDGVERVSPACVEARSSASSGHVRDSRHDGVASDETDVGVVREAGNRPVE